MNPEPGRKFGPYEIQSRLGGGGMGHVFRAWDARLHREVAIKLLNHEYAIPGMRERFLREARAASALNHPNICTIFDIGEQDGDPYLVMELLEGETLKDRILQRGMQLDEIISVARCAAEALGAAHSRGVVHRDIKPANIFLVEKPNGGIQAKILDFGLAKMDGGTPGARTRSLDLTTAGATVGTLAYMSPEQARGEPLDARSDLFSLGVVLYEMATRRVPFQGTTSALVFVQLLNHAPDPVREWNDAVPRDLEKIINKLLAKERTARFQTAGELELTLVALDGKGSGGGWLRKTIATVPLVRAQDPVARQKRPTRSGVSSNPGLHSPLTRPTAPNPLAPGQTNLSSSAGNQTLRPVARVIRPGSTPNPAGNIPAQTSSSGDLVSPTPPAAMPSGNQGPSQRLALAHPRSDAVNEKGTFGSADFGTLQSTPLVSSESALEAGSLAGTESGGSKTDQTSNEAIPTLFSQGRPRVRSSLPIQPFWLGLLATAAFLIACVLYIEISHSRFGSAPLNRGDVVVLADLENRTGVKSLDNSVTEALRIELAQSNYLTLRSGESYLATRRLLALSLPSGAAGGGGIPARKAAERLGAKAYISGTVSGTSALYTLHIEVRDLGSNEILATTETHCNNLQQIPSAVDQIAVDLRSLVGEPRLSVEASSVPLASEGSSNLAALQLYAEAEVMIVARQPVAALANLQEATARDPKFAQGHLKLATLYRQLRAESAADESARLALVASGSAGERTRILAQATFERDATGDYPRATAALRQLTAVSPHDTEALTLLAESLGLQGHMGEALTYAQQALSEDPFYAPAYHQAEMALIGLDRYDAAYQLDLQAQRLNLANPGDSLAAADLDGRDEVVSNLVANLPEGRMEYRPDWTYGILLDSTGRLMAGTFLWKSRAEAAAQNQSLRSAATLLLAQGTLDRALLGECTSPMALLPDSPVAREPPAGRTALFNIGLAAALCGRRERADEVLNDLRLRFPQSFEVNGFFLADIQAAEDLYENQPAAALNHLAPARDFDLVSITPYLRGRAHVAQQEVAIGIVDFQTELAHRGVTYTVGDNVYPAAQLGVARAFADSGDLGNSAQAYRKFLNVWGLADSENPLLGEARAHLNPGISK